MKTPQQILNDYFFSFKDGHKEKIVSAMKEYAKQWVERAAEVADEYADYANDVESNTQGFIHCGKVRDALVLLKQEIDAQ